MALHELEPFDESGAIRVVIEAPRGCGAKLKYEPSLQAFSFGRALPVGLVYPFDWGFVPGTRAEDGDPVDALVLCDVPTYPGVVIPVRALGVVRVTQNKAKGRGREHNDRIVGIPVGAERIDGNLPARLRQEIERFFLNTTYFTAKNARIAGWSSAAAARQIVQRSRL